MNILAVNYNQKQPTSFKALRISSLEEAPGIITKLKSQLGKTNCETWRGIRLKKGLSLADVFENQIKQYEFSIPLDTVCFSRKDIKMLKQVFRQGLEPQRPQSNKANEELNKALTFDLFCAMVEKTKRKSPISNYNLRDGIRYLRKEASSKQPISELLRNLVDSNYLNRKLWASAIMVFPNSRLEDPRAKNVVW